MRYGEKERNSFFLKNTWRMSPQKNKNKILTFHLQENVPVMYCLYQDDSVSMGLN